MRRPVASCGAISRQKSDSMNVRDVLSDAVPSNNTLPRQADQCRCKRFVRKNYITTCDGRFDCHICLVRRGTKASLQRTNE